MLLLTVPDHNAVYLAANHSRRLNPNIVLVTRSTGVQYLRQFRELGILAIQPEFEGAWRSFARVCRAMAAPKRT